MKDWIFAIIVAIFWKNGGRIPYVCIDFSRLVLIQWILAYIAAEILM